MSIRVVTQSGGHLRYPGTPNLKPALVNGEGWYVGFFVRLPPTIPGNNRLILGHDGTANGMFNDASEFGFNAPSGTSPRSFDFLARPSSGNNIYDNSTKIAGAGDLSGSSTLLIIAGVQSFAANDWRAFRAIVRLNGGGATTIWKQTNAANLASAAAFATQAHRAVSQFFVDHGSLPTSAGTEIENVAFVKGLFPHSSGAMLDSALTALATSNYKWDDLVAQYGGEILDWRRFLSASDTARHAGSLALGDLELWKGTAADPTGQIGTGPAQLAPWVFDPPLAFASMPGNDVWEGVTGPAEVRLEGTKPSGMAAIEGRLEWTDGTVVSGFDWSGSLMTYPTATSWRWIGSPPMNIDARSYRLRVRDQSAPGTTVLANYRFNVGHVLSVNGQSQMEWMRRHGGTGANAAPTPAVDARVVLQYLDPFTQGMLSSPVLYSDLSALGSLGSGWFAFAAEYKALLADSQRPWMKVVDITWSGQTMDTWINDIIPAGSETRLLSDYATKMAVACRRRCSGFLRASYVGTSLGYTVGERTLATAMRNVWSATPASVRYLTMGDFRPNVLTSNRDQRATALLDATNIAQGIRFAGWPNDYQECAAGSAHSAVGSALEGPTSDPSAEGHEAGQLRLARAIARMVTYGLDLQTAINPLGQKHGVPEWTDASKTAYWVPLEPGARYQSASSLAGGTRLNHWTRIGAGAWRDSSGGANPSARLIQNGPRGKPAILVTLPSGENGVGQTVAYIYQRGMQYDTQGMSGTAWAGEVRSHFDQHYLYDSQPTSDGRGVAYQPTTALTMTSATNEGGRATIDTPWVEVTDGQALTPAQYAALEVWGRTPGSGSVQFTRTGAVAAQLDVTVTA